MGRQACRPRSIAGPGQASWIKRGLTGPACLPVRVCMYGWLQVDLILHPLKSELNWPIGGKRPLDFTRSREGLAKQVAS